MKAYKTPPAAILAPTNGAEVAAENYTDVILNIFARGGLPCEVVRVFVGATVTAYHIDLYDPLYIARVKRLIYPLSATLRIRDSIKIVASVYAHFCLEIPRRERQTVYFREVLLTKQYNDSKSPLTAICGLSSDGSPVVVDLARMPHTLIAGTTGSGKSVALNTIINSILFKATPERVRMVLIDPKQTELSAYEGLPHLLCPIIKESGHAVNALQTLCTQMIERYEEMSRRGIKDVVDYPEYPRIVIIVDELADLMMTSRDAVESSLIRIAQLGRAAGFHLVIATQSPRANVITGLIRANINGRIALKTADVRESVITLNHKGAETLLGRGDAFLKLPDKVEEVRYQTAYISDSEIAAVVDYWKTKAIEEVK